MAVFLDVALQLAKSDADGAAKEVEKWAKDAANDISKILGGSLSKVFDGLDGSKARDELKALQDEYAKTARIAGDALRQQIRDQENAAAAIRRVTEINTKYGEESSKTAKALAAQHNAQALAAQSALDAAAAADVAAQAHEHLESASKKAAGAAGGLNTSMLLAAGGMAAAGAAAFEATKKLYDMGEQWADVRDKITFATGKIGSDAAAMSDKIAKIADGTAAPIDKIGDVYTQLTRLKDLSGKTLNDLTHQVADYDQMAEKAGSDPLNLGAFTRTMQEFHVPAERVSTDLDTIVSAAQDGQVPVNELVQTLHEAGPAADIAGLSFGQMVNVLAAIDDSGVNAETALKGFRLALGNIAADSKQLQKQIKFGPDENELQRLKDVIQKIQDLHQAGNDVAAIDLGKTAFGRSWADIGQAILDDKLNVDKLNTSFDATPGKIEAMHTATQRFGDDWKIVKNQITDALKPLAEPIFEKMDEGLKGFSLTLEAVMQGKGMQLLTSLVNPFHKDQFFVPWIDPGAGHTGESGREHRGLPPAGGAPGPNNPTGGAGGDGKPSATKANVPTAAPYFPIDLNPADKPPGAESYDQWISNQKEVQSAQNRQVDTANKLAEARQHEVDLLASGKATQEELNSVTDEINKAQRDNLEATQELTIAKNKETEDANKQEKDRKGRKSDNPFDDYDPFTEATKHSQGLIPQLASLAAAFATNEALGNPYGKIQAAKRGEDPSNPLYVSEVGDVRGTGGGIPGAIGRVLQGVATGQASGGHLADWDKVAGAESGGNWADNTGNGFYGGLQFTPSTWAANKPPGAPDNAAQATPDQQKQAADNVMRTQGSGAWPATSAAHPDWFGGAAGAQSALGPSASNGLNLSTIPIAAQKYANDCIDASARIILSHSGVNMTEDQLEGVIAPGGTIDSQAAGLNKLDPQGGFKAMQGSGGSLQAMFNAIKASIDNGTGSILNVAPGSSLAGRTFAPGHFIAVTGYNPDGTINVSDTAGGGRTYSVSEGDAFQATQGRGIVAGTGSGPGATQGIPGYATGGSVAASDTTPAMLTPGEFVVKKDVAQKNLPALQALNAGDMPKAGAPRMSSTGSGPKPSTRGASNSSSVTPPPAGPRVGQGSGPGFGIGGGLIGLAETAAVMAAMGAAGMADGGPVPDPTQTAGGGGKGGKGGGGGAGDSLTAVLNRTVGYFGQLGGIAAQGIMSSLIPGASQKGGIMDGGILSKLAGGIAGAHPSAPNTAGRTPTPLASSAKPGDGSGGDTTHIGQQTNGVHIDTLVQQPGQSGTDLASDLAFRSYAGYGPR